MKKRPYKVFIEDIIDAMKKIEEYTQNLTSETFSKNKLVVDAVIRNLEIIGEASKNVPEGAKEKNPDIPWKSMIGLRNITIHEYFGVDLNIIWQIIKKNIPETIPKLEEMLKRITNNGE